MSTTEWAIVGLFYALTVYGFYAVWVHPETTRYWYRLAQFTDRDISPREYAIAVWVARLLLTLVLLVMTWVGVVLAREVIGGWR